ncbi:CDP-abequose synthase [Tepiditoga spiralis]|uniref:CDP-abequose synthase n=1 Tax=Tepiditoga spiralis TaxID=2108365 RepID=A0A7G1G5P6_9BACT|nr:NAD-dependent epimerase/dehydratase family protein [Tepiditoga spiralis]BBE30217.1 CDP-abequose synthase [Tepiditoga spiralis]
MEKILITGGFGFIGKNLIEYLSKQYKIVVIDKYVDEQFIKKYNEIKYYEYNFFENDNIKLIISDEDPDYIINLISIVTAERNMDIFNDMIQANINIFLKLYEASKALKKLKLFLHFGSGEEYGNIKAPFNENNREYPNSPYALAKQITTNTAMMLNKNYNFPIAVVRPGNLFGKYQEKNKFITYIINQLLDNNKIETTLGEQKRDFIYASDFANGISLILKKYDNFLGEIVNLSSGKSISLKKIILFCKDYIKSDSEIEFGKIPYRENEIMDFELDISKFKNRIGQYFNIDIKEGLKKYIELLKGENK